MGRWSYQEAKMCADDTRPDSLGDIGLIVDDEEGRIFGRQQVILRGVADGFAGHCYPFLCQDRRWHRL